jgi:peptidoglycan/LPS O-acetylase OafA/YrhL
MAICALALATLVALAIARTGFPLPDQTRFGCIDGLRGYLALLVLIHHFSLWLQTSRLGLGWVESAPFIGSSAVAIFFMVTGFLFYPKILKGFRQTEWLPLYLTRWFRIYPLALLSIACIALIALIGRDFAASGSLQANLVALLQWVTFWDQPPLFGDEKSWLINAGVLWSLRHELFFYTIVLPACALVRDLTRQFSPSWMIPALLMALSFADRRLVGAELLSTLPFFAVGMFAYEICMRPWSALLRSPVAAALCVAGCAYTVAVIQVSPYSPRGFLSYAALFTCIAAGNNFGGAFSNRGALVLGECSYGIYIIHGIVLYLLFAFAPAFLPRYSDIALIATLPAIAAGIVLLTAAAYLLIERPGIRIGKALAERLASRTRFKPNEPILEVAP